MRTVSRLAVVLFAVLYAVSIVVTFLKVERHLASGGRPFHLAAPSGGHYLFRRTAKTADANDRGGPDHPLVRKGRLGGAAGADTDAGASAPVAVRRPDDPPDGQRPGRFPRRGTPEFRDRCGWTLEPPDPVPGGNCTILVRPGDGGNEGVSCWSMQVVNGYFHARQSGCRFLVDYGGDVDVRSVMEPALMSGGAVGTESEEGLYDWSVPPGFVCAKKDRCFHTGAKATFDSGKIDDRTLVASPNYRFAFGARPDKEGKCRHCLYPSSGDDMRKALPGFNLESGVACAYANLFRGPAYPAAEEFEPRLFTELLPAVRDPSALVISIYIRSGWADTAAKYEEQLKKGQINATEKEPTERDSRNSMVGMMRCAMNVEDHFHAKVQAGNTTPYSRVVWMILTDSPSVKKWAYEPIPWRKNKKAGDDGGRYAAVNRTVLVTSSRGVHTRTRRKPSTADFAEGFLDWYLIGESDAVVLNRLTFGYTAASRTSRPVYTQMDNCAAPETHLFDEPASGQKLGHENSAVSIRVSIEKP